MIGPASFAALFNNRVLGDIFMKGAQTEILNHFQHFTILDKKAKFGDSLEFFGKLPNKFDRSDKLVTRQWEIPWRDKKFPSIRERLQKLGDGKKIEEEINLK